MTATEKIEFDEAISTLHALLTKFLIKETSTPEKEGMNQGAQATNAN